MIGELERLLRRGLLLALAMPLLVFCGLALGKLTHRALALPEGTAVRVVTGREVRRDRLEVLSGVMHSLRMTGERTAEYVVLYRDHVAPVEETLRRRGVPAATARRVAWPLVEYSYRRALDPATVLAVLLIESRGRPDATSPVGARGLMQVMPSWAGRIRDCGRDLYDVEDNLCNGTWILAEAYGRFRGNERRSLLAYNGCVRGTFTADCKRYPERVTSLRRQILAEWDGMRLAAPTLADDS